MSRLTDRVVFVTGAARGIGLGISRAVLDAGGRVAMADRDEQALADAAEGLAADGPGREDVLFTTRVDVGNEDSVDAALSAACRHFGQLDGLVNNAGVIRLGPELDTGAEDWRLQMEVNVIGVHNCCRRFADMLIDTERPGSIVNIASNAGKVGYPGMAGYNASKAAVINLTRTLSGELSEHRINVNAVCPGGVYTPMLMEVARNIGASSGENPDDLVATMAPAQLGRHIRPGEIGRVVVFLLSDDAVIIRGQSINADGGDTPY